MRTVLITFIFAITAIYFAKMLIALQFSPARSKAFVAIAFFSIALISRHQFALYLVIGSVSFFDPRYWWTFIRLWLHQWLILASILIFIGLRIHQRRKFSFNRLDLILGILLLTFIISFLGSHDLTLSIKWTIYYFIFLGGYFLLRLSVDREKQLLGVIAFLIFCGAASGITSILRHSEGVRVTSLVLANPNSLGNYLALILPLVLAFLIHGKLAPVRKFLLLLSLAALAVSLILTMSRSSWLGCTVGLLALGFIKPRLKYFAMVVPVLVIIIFLPPVQRRLIEDKADPGVTYRQTKTRMAFQMFKERPILGHGPGGFQALAPTMEAWAIHAHSAVESMYMRMLAEGGIFQSLVFIYLIIYVTYLGITSIKALSAGFLQTAVVGSLAAFWAGLGIGVGEDLLLFPMTNWLFGLYMGVIIKARELGGLETTEECGKMTKSEL